MKRTCSLSSIAILIVSFTLISCKKEISPSETKEATSIVAQAALTSTAGDCTPSVLGVHSVHRTGINPKWVTLMQRFYNPEGTLTNLKAYITLGGDVYHGNLVSLDLPWGNVTYHGNQVFLTDALKNKLVMRVTLNDSGLPEATYFYGEYPTLGNAPSPGPIIDTTYYYYTGNRLEHIFRTSSTPHLGSSGWSLLNFKYDAYGNIQVIGSDNPGDGRTWFSYDYSKPVTGIITHYEVTRPLKLLEYMGLLSLPMVHQPTQIKWGTYQPGSSWPFETYPALETIFRNVAYTDGGQVYSYFNIVYSQEYHNTYYTGWHCLFFPPPGAHMPNVIGELEGFKKQFPNQ